MQFLKKPCKLEVKYIQIKAAIEEGKPGQTNPRIPYKHTVQCR